MFVLRNHNKNYEILENLDKKIRKKILPSVDKKNKNVIIISVQMLGGDKLKIGVNFHTISPKFLKGVVNFQTISQNLIEEVIK